MDSMKMVRQTSSAALLVAGSLFGLIAQADTRAETQGETPRVERSTVTGGAVVLDDAQLSHESAGASRTSDYQPPSGGGGRCTTANRCQRSV